MPVFSFEFFPPKTDQGEQKLLETVARLKELGPSFVSVTKTGAKPAEKTIELTARFKHEIGIEAMSHMTCATAGRDEMARIFGLIRDAGIENVLALRGDPPRDQPAFVRPADGFDYATELVRFIRERDFGFCLGGAGYPETHPDAATADDDLVNLAEGGRRRRVRHHPALLPQRGVLPIRGARPRDGQFGVPIVPGIMPITNVGQIERIASLSGACIPPALQADLNRARDDDGAALDVGIAYATAQCRELLRGGAPGIHFYTLNQSPATSAILRALRDEHDWRSS